MKDIEIITWVKFNKPGLAKEIKELVKTCDTELDFLSKVKDTYGLTITEAEVITNNFYQKNK